MYTPTVNIIGAGRLGKTLAKLMVLKKTATIAGVYNKNVKNSLDAIEFIGEGIPCTSFKQLPDADLYFLTVPDALISSVINELLEYNKPKPGKIFIHCSGVSSSEILSPVKNWGGYLASLHPSITISHPETKTKKFTGTYCAIEGDHEAVTVLFELCEKIGGKPYLINQQNKAAYHSAGVFSTNYLITLAQTSIECLEQAGVDQDQALDIVITYMQSALTNLSVLHSTKQALTGPLKRGDVMTVQKNLQSLKEKTKELYQILGQLTLNLIEHQNKETELELLNELSKK